MTKYYLIGSVITQFLYFLCSKQAAAFSNELFSTERPPVLSQTEGVYFDLPDFEELFDRVRQISPLARSALEGSPVKGFKGIDDSPQPHLPWRTVEKNSRHPVHLIEKIENFQGHPAPLLRFRSSLEGPCIGECFANFIMSLDERKRWDDQIDDVYELYPIIDLDSANIEMGFGRYGDCSRLGIGYCRTTKSGPISPREQLTLCGIQNFNDGSCIIWGTEMEEHHDHLLPGEKRVERAKSHIFSTTLMPTGENSFDVEYVLQLEAGGKLPQFLTTPVMLGTIKNLFRTAKNFYNGKDGKLAEYLEEKAKEDMFLTRHSLLMTP